MKQKLNLNKNKIDIIYKKTLQLHNKYKVWWFDCMTQCEVTSLIPLYTILHEKKVDRVDWVREV